MHLLGRLVCGTAMLAAVVAVWPAAAHAEGETGPGLRLKPAQSSFDLDEPVRLTFAVTNTAGTACALTRTPEGAVQVTSVRRDGKELHPVLARSFYLDGIGQAVRAGLVNAEPGSTVDVSLTAVRVHDGDNAGGVVLRSVAATPDGGGLDSLWPVGAPGRYEVTASYAVPAVEGGPGPACTGMTGAQTVAFTVGRAEQRSTWLWIAAGGALALVLLAGVVVLLVRRRHAPAAAILLLVAVIGAAGSGQRPAYADYEIDPNAGAPVSGVDFRKAVEGCLAGFSAPGGDPAGIMGRLKDKKTPKVRIIPTPGGSGAFETPEGPDGKGSSTITWNPNSTDPYSDGVPRDPCSALYHELAHADDISRDKVPQGECGDTGIKTAEVKATMTENRYRQSKGLSPRTEYDGKKLPKSLEDCKKPKKKTPPAKGPVKLCEGSNQCASSTGDPHLTTFDHARYSFQAVGEFVLVRSTGGDALEVQSRQAPLGTLRTVSVNAAVAFRLGTHRVELALAGGVTQVRIDGETAVLAAGARSLPGGGTLVRRDSDVTGAAGYDVRWPDGSAAAVDQIGTAGYRLLLKLDKNRAGKVEGLLGNFDGDPANDLAPRGGGAPLAQPAQFDALYPSYADSWRIAQADSLFHYAPGHSTATFTDKSYPDRSFTVDNLDPARRAQAEAICRWAGITEAWQFAECVLDVGVSGRPEFATSGADTELVARPAKPPIAASPLTAGTLSVGGTERLTFTGRAGQAIFVDVPAATLPDSCSAYRLLDASGKYLNSGCNINGSGHIDRTVLEADGQYTVALDDRAGLTGKATVRVYAAQDVTSVIEANGAAVSFTLDEPGAQARYRFTGTAGQRVFIDVPGSDLPDQCSPLRLLDPTGTLLNSGCVINGFGDIEGTLLPVDGSYTIVVDPVDRTTGSAQLLLYAAKDRTAPITPNGATVVADVTQPGAVLRYEFTATAGESVTVTATAATLPDQCSPLKLVSPTGRMIDSGCVINGKGDIGPTPLPSSGTYALVVDPSGAATGTVTLAMRRS